MNESHKRVNFILRPNLGGSYLIIEAVCEDLFNLVIGRICNEKLYVFLPETIIRENLSSVCRAILDHTEKHGRLYISVETKAGFFVFEPQQIGQTVEQAIKLLRKIREAAAGY